jgi:hypothetical protein
MSDLYSVLKYKENIHEIVTDLICKIHGNY